MLYDCPFGIGVEIRITSVFNANRSSTNTRLGCKTTKIFRQIDIIFEYYNQ